MLTVTISCYFVHFLACCTVSRVLDTTLRFEKADFVFSLILTLCQPIFGNFWQTYTTGIVREKLVILLTHLRWSVVSL